MKPWGTPTASPLTWALSGGDGIRTHGLYIANVALCQLSYTPGGVQNTASALRTSGSRRFDQGLSEDFPGGGVSIPSGSLTIPLLPSR